jgi:alanine dehydrogenase
MTSTMLLTQEKMAKVLSKNTSLKIGIPKEKFYQENRVPLTPEGVSTLVNNGHEVVVESKSGEGGHFYDNDYSDAGAQIVFSSEEVFESNLILKVAPPTTAEAELLKPNQYLISALHLPTLKGELLQQLMSKKVTAIAFEYLKDSIGSFPIIRSMSEIAGNAAILISAELLSDSKNGKGILLGGITGVPPAKVVIIGAGIVGEFACHTAIGLGAEVKVFDNSIYKLKRLQNNVGSRVFTSILHPNILLHELRSADVVIGSVRNELGHAEQIVSEEMVQLMKAGSVIIDVSIDQGGSFETSEVTSHKNPTFKKYDVIHYCVPNIASRFARTASYAISNVLTPKLLNAGSMGGFEQLLWTLDGTKDGVYLYKGNLTKKNLSDKFSLKYTDLNIYFNVSQQ